MSTAVRTSDLGRRYRRRWALRDCSVEIPEASVVALVGPNGAGKTTLLHLLAGLLRPTEGTVGVLGADPATDPALLARLGLVAQDMPLYRSFTVRDMLRAGRALNRRWDDGRAIHRLDELAIPLDQRCGTLSGGQRAQVALAMALAKRPEVLLLDEPLASLDPLARRAFLQTLMVGTAEDGLTVVLSSHLITELERVCDHLVLLAGGRIQMAGGVEPLLAGHRVLTGPQPPGPIAGVSAVIDETPVGRGTALTVRTDGPVHDPRWVVEGIGLEDLVLAYLARSSETTTGPARELGTVGAAS